MDNYILRTEQTGAADSRLLFFEQDAQLTALEHLVEYLKHLILLNEYTGTGPLIKAFWKWNKDDSLDELLVHRLAEIPEGDSVDWVFRVIFKETSQEITQFSVRIEG